MEEQHGFRPIGLIEERPLTPGRTPWSGPAIVDHQPQVCITYKSVVVQNLNVSGSILNKLFRPAAGTFCFYVVLFPFPLFLIFVCLLVVWIFGFRFVFWWCGELLQIMFSPLKITACNRCSNINRLASISPYDVHKRRWKTEGCNACLSYWPDC